MKDIGCGNGFQGVVRNIMDENKGGSDGTIREQDCSEDVELDPCAALKLESDCLEADLGTFCLDEEIVHDCVEAEDQDSIGQPQADPDYIHAQQATVEVQSAVYAEAEEDLPADVEFGEDVELVQISPPTTSVSNALTEDAAHGKHDAVSFLNNLGSPPALSKQVALSKERRRYPCEECGESFVKPSNLKQHKLSHATEVK